MSAYFIRVPAGQFDAVVAGDLDLEEIMPPPFELVPSELNPESKSVSLEKFWQALHFLLTGHASEQVGELGSIILGGQEFGSDFGYGPVRWIAPSDVRRLNQSLSAVSNAELRARFDPAALAEADVYPSIWDEPPDELWDELEHYLRALRSIYQSAAGAGDAIATWIS